MGNPFKQVKTAIKDAYHSKSSSNSSHSKPTSGQPTVTKSQHAVPPPHETVAADTPLSLSKSHLSQPPPNLSSRQEDQLNTPQPSQSTAEPQLAGPDTKQPTAKKSAPGPQLPPRQPSTDHIPYVPSEKAIEASQVSPQLNLDIPPSVPEKEPLEPENKPEERKDNSTPVTDDGPVSLPVRDKRFEPMAIVPEPQTKETEIAFSSVPDTPLTRVDGDKSGSKVASLSVQPVATVKTIPEVKHADEPIPNAPKQASELINALPAPPSAEEAAGSKLPVEAPVLSDIAPVSQPIAVEPTPDIAGTAPSQDIPVARVEPKSSAEKAEMPEASSPSNAVTRLDDVNSQPKEEKSIAETKPIAATSVPAAQPTVEVSKATSSDEVKLPEISGANDVGFQKSTGFDLSKPNPQEKNEAAAPIPANALNPAHPQALDAEREATGAIDAPCATTAAVTAPVLGSKPEIEKAAAPDTSSSTQPSQSSQFSTLDSTTSASAATLAADSKGAPTQGEKTQANSGSTMRNKPFALYSKPILDHLQRVYDGLVPDSARKVTADAAVTDHDHQESTDYFMRFVQKEAQPRPPGFRLRGFTEFLEYMTTSANAVAPLKDQDMTLPLPNYYSNSSHNTYLTGNQLYSECSSDVYKDVLEKGCRCLEIDVWDGEDNSDASSTSSSSSSDSASHTGSGIGKKLHSAHSAESQIASGLKREVKSEARGVMSSISGGLHKISSKAKNMMPEVAPDGDMSERTSIDTNATSETANGRHGPVAGGGGLPPTRIEPRVLHGHTLTREVPFREVCEVIRDSAFVTSDLPVIVSLEVHAGHEQQKIMVEIMTEVWKDLLVSIPQKTREKLMNGEDATLPSPADLRHKILIKVKGSPRPEDGSSRKTPSSGAEGEVLSLEPSATASSTSVDTPPSGERDVKVVPRTKLIEELSALGIYTSAYSFKGLDRPEAHLANHIFSLSEPKLLEYFNKDRKTLFDHNRNFMMRTYPSQFRIRSSNPDPSFSWRQGVQFAALNWQSIDIGMMINHAMFEGSNGWILKPEAYRSDSWRRTLKSPPADPRKTLSLSIDIYAGQDIPLPAGETRPKKFHPYISCQLHVERPKDSAEANSQESESEDDVSETWKRKTTSSVGNHPDFDGQRLQFPRCPHIIEELTFVRFKVKDHELMRHPLSSWACVRLDRLQSGFRILPLLDAKGQDTNGVLLICVSKQIS